ncbi:MAG: V-type ATP synthase subunit D [Candidatus Latescibacteria bacterium]|nr:V-type ATP synthase subunit D [bacterium]MBD3422847.1 V-type ATP synthase subunit D [Candidatus Latescibacterota bacterium]
MTLIRLRRRLELARRGHKLLKNKQEKLMQNFFSLIREANELRSEVEGKLLSINNSYIRGRIFSDEQAIYDALELSDAEGELIVDSRYEMGIRIPVYQVEFPDVPPSYRLSSSSPALDGAFEELYRVFPSLLELASSENALLRMAEELEKTRRRVNALEYVLIPDLEETIKNIERKLSENERSTQTRLMKIKDMVQ